MNRRTPSWHEVANALAARLAHQANCEYHPPADADPDNCAFCKDRAAYQLWERKAGVERKVDPEPARGVDVFTLLWGDAAAAPTTAEDTQP